MPHLESCTRTADTYDPDCPRCHELRTAAGHYRASVVANTAEERQLAFENRERGDWWLTVLFNTVFLSVLAAIALGGLYLFVRFVKMGMVRLTFGRDENCD